MACTAKNNPSTSAAVTRCNDAAHAEAKPRDPVRELAIDIVNVFAGLLREEEMHDAFVEVYERIKGRLTELKGNAPAPSSRG